MTPAESTEPKARQPRLHLDPATGATVLDPKPSRLAKAMADGKAARQDRPTRATASRATTSTPKRASAQKAEAKTPQVDRVPPAEILAMLQEHGVSRKQFAAAMHVTVSRVSEWVTDRRPRSHMARSRWSDAVKAAKSAAKAATK